jgi:predicted double-glycine peptidase
MAIPPDEMGADFHLGGIGAGGGWISKPVESFRDQRFRGMVPQELDYSCGAAAMATLLQHYYGEPVNEQSVTVAMLEGGDQEKIRREGFSLLDMKRYAESLGYQTKGFAIRADVLDRLAIPAITLINTSGYSHFVVLKGSRDGEIFLADPALGNRAMRRSEFLEEWSGAVFFVAGKRDPSAGPSSLEMLQAKVEAPRDEVRDLEFQGLRNMVFSPAEFRVR